MPSLCLCLANDLVDLRLATAALLDKFFAGGDLLVVEREVGAQEVEVALVVVEGPPAPIKALVAVDDGLAESFDVAEDGPAPEHNALVPVGGRGRYYLVPVDAQDVGSAFQARDPQSGEARLN